MSKIECFETDISRAKRDRKVWVYLPDGYDCGTDNYPVIYMHDGQNLFFDELTAYGVAWHADVALDKIFAATGCGAIVVGVESVSKLRLSEYSPWRVDSVLARKAAIFAPNNGGEGGAYAEFFAGGLKKYVDTHYRTDPSRRATAVIGSSMGGFISCYLALKYQQVYETMGLFSTFTAFNQRAFDSFLLSTPQTFSQHALIYCGGKEGLEIPDDYMVNCSVRLYRSLSARGIATELVIDSEMKHFETAWDKHFYKFAADFLARYYGLK